MAVITNAPDSQQPFVDKAGRITRAWLQWLLGIVSNATTGGTVTHTGALTSGKTIVGNGADDIKVSTLTATVVKSTTGTLSAATAGTDYTALAFKTIAVSGQSDIVADSAADLLTVAAGSGVTLTTNASTDTLTIAATGTGGTVTNTGTLTSGKLIQGNGGVDVTANATTATVTKLTAGTPSAASAGTDYVAPGSITTDGITMSTAKLLGRTTASSGAVEEITAGTGLSLSAGTLTATGTGGTVTTTGSPASGNLTKFSGATSITNADLTGDVTTSGTVATTLAASGASAGTYGSATVAPVVTVDAKGRITTITTATITPGAGTGGAMSLIQTQTLGSDGSFSFTSIPGTYAHLRLVVWGRITGAVTSDYIYIQLNGDSSNKYDEQRLAGNDVTAVVGQTFAATQSRLAEFPGANSSSNTQTGSGEMFLPAYANATWQKTMVCTSGVCYGTTNGTQTVRIHEINYRGTSAITQIDVTAGTGSIKTGSMAWLYGVS